MATDPQTRAGMEPDMKTGRDTGRSTETDHALRNAVNSALLSATVARRLLAQGQATDAAEFLADACQACERAQHLLGGAAPAADDGNDSLDPA